MPPLTPTVHERLARCGTRVYVSGLTAGATVVVSVDGTETSEVVWSATHTFTVPPLTAGAKVRARQNDGSGFTPDSPPVEVEDALVPPWSAPLLPAEVGGCSECVKVDGLVPGCEVELSEGGQVVGHAIAGRFGSACVPVKLQGRGQLTARMIVCGSTGPFTWTSIVTDGPLPKPVLVGPIYGCQRTLPLKQLRRGALVRPQVEGDAMLSSVCACSMSMNYSIGFDLVPGQRVHAQQYWSMDPCQGQGPGPWSDWQKVIEPDEGIKPVVLDPLFAGDQLIRVENQILGGTLTILIRNPGIDDPKLAVATFGPRPAGTDLEIALNEPLGAGQQVAVIQELCGHSEQSDWVGVEAQPDVVYAPVILPPLYLCAAAVQVSGLHPGALVRLYQNGFVIGLGWAGSKSSIAIPPSPSLVTGSQVSAIQWVGGKQSPASPPVTVLPLGSPLLHIPRILTPVGLKDEAVWVSGVTPGARITIHSNDQVIGEADAAEPIVRVAVAPVSAWVEARAHLCSGPLKSAYVVSLVDPGQTGLWAPESGEELKHYGGFFVPQHGKDGGFSVPIGGQLYYPALNGKIHPSARDRPLVVIAHGFWDPEQNSYLGYKYLARHLTRWGMFVFSLNMDEVNNHTDPQRQQWSRGEIIREATTRLLNDLTDKVDPNRIGFVGHSVGGEGVVAARKLCLDKPTPFDVKGVVSLAPTHWVPDLQLTKTKYLLLFGSLDVLIWDLLGESLKEFKSEPVYGDPKNDPYDGFRIHDKAWRPKTLAWIYGATHNQFNHEWRTGKNLYEGGLVGISMTLSQQERIARSLINAFFQDALLDQHDYAGYLQGLILPQDARPFKIFMQHLAEAPKVVDDFGDANTQLNFPAETPLDKTKNRQGGSVAAKGAGLGIWQDIDHKQSVQNSVHDTRSVELSWTAPTVVYSSASPPVKTTLTDVLSLRVAQFYEDAATNPVDEEIDLFVEVMDAGAHTATVRLGSVGTVPYPDATHKPLTVFRAVRLPMDAFHAVNLALDLSKLTQVTLKLAGRPTGHLVVDDIEFTAS